MHQPPVENRSYPSCPDYNAAYSRLLLEQTFYNYKLSLGLSESHLNHVERLNLHSVPVVTGGPLFPHIFSPFPTKVYAPNSENLSKNWS